MRQIPNLMMTTSKGGGGEGGGDCNFVPFVRSRFKGRP